MLEDVKKMLTDYYYNNLNISKGDKSFLISLITKCDDEMEKGEKLPTEEMKQRFHEKMQSSVKKKN